MPKALSIATKNLIHGHVTIFGADAVGVLHAVFLGDTTKCSLEHLRKIVRYINTQPEEALLWKDERTIHSGRKRMLDGSERDSLLDRIEASPSTRLTKLEREFAESFYGWQKIFDAPSYSTVRRTLIRAGLTRKVLTRVHTLQSQEERLQYFRDTAHVHISRWVDVDEMGLSRKEFFEKYGWAPEGEDAVKLQLKINGDYFTVIAAYTPYGFLCWEIIKNDTNDAEKFENFLRNRFAHAVNAIQDPFLAIDNAAIHKTLAVLAALEEVMEGKYRFSSPYSPQDKPVERGFANIKNYLREHEDEVSLDPEAWINKAFELYSIGGERGHEAWGHWARYRENHQFWINNP